MLEAPDIARCVVDHYRRHRRDLPWRNADDPYAIWISEVMLQQTRIATVIPYYRRWLARFPTLRALAEAPLDDVLAAWSGLGYYSRARNLHRGAREVVARHAGRLPAEARELRSLPGIGRYTAGAIASMAFGQREPVVDGNVSRVLARVFELEGEIKSPAATRALWQLAGSLVPADAPGDFNQGLMEIGETICTPTQPACLICPLATACRARATGRQAELPVMPARVADRDKPELAMAAVWIHGNAKLALGKRPAEGLYGGLWELPNAPTVGELAGRWGESLVLTAQRPVAVVRRTLTHRRLVIQVWCARLRGGLRVASPAAIGYERLAWHLVDAAAGELGQLGISSATRHIIQRYRENQGWRPETRR